MRKAVYPGSFDPITNGHLDVITRAQKLFDEVVVAIAADNTKTPLFSMEERVDMIEKSVKDLKIPVKVKVFSGLLVNYVSEEGACAVVRGLRAVSDFEFEFQLALMNRKINDQVETIFLMPRDTYTYLSSSIVREISRLGGPVTHFVPPHVEKALKQKFNSPG
jgi:pantetheine-phosphate adenylyltransferase